MTLGTDHGPWSSEGGQWAFRHLWPSGNLLAPQTFQGPARGNFLFIDGHVEGFGPNDNINDRKRFAYRW